MENFENELVVEDFKKDLIDRMNVFIGRKIDDKLISQLKNAIDMQMHKKLDKYHYDKISFGVETVAKDRINIYPKNIYTALVFSGIEVPFFYDDSTVEYFVEGLGTFFLDFETNRVYIK